MKIKSNEGKMKTKKYFYREAVQFNSGEEKEVKAYLDLWKRYLIRKLEPDLKFVEDKFIENSFQEYGPLIQKWEKSLGIKICFEGTFQDEDILEGWHSVEDSPGSDGEVWIYVDKGVELGYYDSKDQFICRGDPLKQRKITHWKEIDRPSPPPSQN